MPGALEVVRKLRENGVVVSAGHTDASTEEMLAGLDAGITAVTHLFNAMTPFVHREPGPVGVALADRRVTAGLIVDGVHVHPVAVAGAHAALGPDRLALVTDSVAALGASSTGDGARTSDGRLMGSIVPMDQAVRNLVQFTGCSKEMAIASAASTPARVISASRKGMIAPGSDADLALLTPQLEVVATVIGGCIEFNRLS
jgi:N-acetylglucosamine-6-phosphate deacetylase